MYITSIRVMDFKEYKKALKSGNTSELWRLSVDMSSLEGLLPGRRLQQGVLKRRFWTERGMEQQQQ